MFYKKPDLEIIMIYGENIITSSILDKDEINGGDDIDYDTNANGV